MAIFSILLSTILTFNLINSQVLPGAVGGVVGGVGAVGGVVGGVGVNGLGVNGLGVNGLGVNGLGVNGGLGVNPLVNGGLGVGLGGLSNVGIGGGNPITNGIAQLLVGQYQWIGQDGSIYNLFVCAGLPGDRNIYASVQRSTINAFGLPDGAGQFSFIVARGILNIGADGAVITLRGFRLANAFGVDDDFTMLLVFSRCDNLFQLEIFDETITLSKISSVPPFQQQCFRPSFVNTFNNFGGTNGFAQFQSNILPWNFRNQLNGPFRSIYSLRRTPLNNGGFNVFGCGGFQNPNSLQFLNGRRNFLGPMGPYGHLGWQNSLLINAWQDDFDFPDFDFPDFDDFGFGCQRGIEFQMFTDDGRLWCTGQCAMRPTVGWGGFLSPIQTPFQNFGIGQCPVPNYGALPVNQFPGWSPLNFNGLNGLGAFGGAAGIAGVGGVGVVPGNGLVAGGAVLAGGVAGGVYLP